MSSNYKRKHNWLLYLVSTIFIVFLFWFLFWPTNKYAEAPGSATNLTPLVKVNHQRDHWSGKFMLMTVGIRGPLTPALILYSKMQPYTSIVTQNNLMGSETNSQYMQVQKYYMQTAINNAISVACKQANVTCHSKYDGVYIMDVNRNSKFKKDLQVGDVITAINGKSFSNSQQFIDYVHHLKVGQTIKITYLRNGKTKQTTHKLINIGSTKHPQAGLGITLTDKSSIKSQVPINVDVGNIGGPSAGLMLTLQIYSQLAHRDLLHGHKVAGTGTMASDGTVGIIGGIDKKVVAANEAHAQVFFAPNYPATKELKAIDPGYRNNYDVAVETAKHLHTKMKIVPVKNFQDALHYLETEYH